VERDLSPAPAIGDKDQMAESETKPNEFKFESEQQAGYIWFPFYFNDWLTDPIVDGMTAAEEGVYIRLLSIQARDNFLPLDLQVCARLCKDARTGAKWLQKWADLCIPVQPWGKRANTKLLNLLIKMGKFRLTKNTEETKKKKTPNSELESGVGLDGVCEDANGFPTEEAD